MQSASRLYDHRATTDVIARNNGHHGTHVLARAASRKPEWTQNAWEAEFLNVIRQAGLPEPETNDAFHVPDHGHCEPDYRSAPTPRHRRDRRLRDPRHPAGVQKRPRQRRRPHRIRLSRPQIHSRRRARPRAQAPKGSARATQRRLGLGQVAPAGSNTTTVFRAHLGRPSYRPAGRRGSGCRRSCPWSSSSGHGRWPSCTAGRAERALAVAPQVAPPPAWPRRVRACRRDTRPAARRPPGSVNEPGRVTSTCSCRTRPTALAARLGHAGELHDSPRASTVDLSGIPSVPESSTNCELPGR